MKKWMMMLAFGSLVFTNASFADECEDTSDSTVGSVKDVKSESSVVETRGAKKIKHQQSANEGSHEHSAGKSDDGHGSIEVGGKK